MKLFSRSITTAVLSICFVQSVLVTSPLVADGYNAIGARKPKNLKAKKITFVGCSLDGALGKYKGPRRDVGTATFLGTLTATQAKNLIKPRKAKANARVAGIDYALVNGKIPYTNKKNLTTLNTEIDNCVPMQTATGTGTWIDEARSTMGSVSVNVTVDREARTLSMQTSVSGFPLGVVDAANIPPETYTVTIPEGETSSEFSFNSSFVPGVISGTASIDEQTGTFNATGTATHNSEAEGFANTAATFTATGPLSGSNVGSITITGNFPAGNNDFTISTTPNS